MRRRIVMIGAVLTALAALIIAPTIATGTIPNNGVINACYVKSGGALHVIDASVRNCSKSETALSWNVTGPAGSQGATGPAGPQGTTGPRAPRALQGLRARRVQPARPPFTMPTLQVGKTCPGRLLWHASSFCRLVSRAGHGLRERREQ